MTYKDIRRLTTKQITDDIARRLDPLAFRNRDRADKEMRRKAVYRRIALAMDEYYRRETNYDYNSEKIQDADIPW